MTNKPLAKRLKTSLDELRMQMMGTQILFGFQLQIVIMTEAFDHLPQRFQTLHIAGLAFTAISTALLLTLAAIHRIAFAGDDDPRFSHHRRLVSERNSHPPRLGNFGGDFYRYVEAL